MGDYYFNSTDGCELCAALEGWYDEEPPRPHPNCNCTIIASAETEEVNGSSWSYTVDDWERDSQRPGEAFVILVTVRVECFNGRTIEDNFKVEFIEAEAPERPDWMARLSAETDAEAERFAAEIAQSCGAGDTFISEYKQGETLPDPDGPEAGFIIPLAVHVDCSGGRIVEDRTSLNFKFRPGEADYVDPFWQWTDDRVEDEARAKAEELSEACPEPDIQGRDVDDDFAVA